MKSNISAAFTLFLLFSLLLFSHLVYSETGKTVSVGLTQTDNVSIQANSGINLDSIENATRSGLETSASWIKQELDYTGGYVLEAHGFYNKGLDGAGDISNLEVSASRLKGLNADWLMRSRVNIQHYRNADFDVDSYDGIRFENTLGHLSDNNSGTDISLHLGYENHDQDAGDSYEGQTQAVKLSHYFSHKSNAPYWALHARIGNDTTNGPLRDFGSASAMAEYRQWSLGSFTGTAAIHWKRDDYDQLVRVSPTGRFMTPRMVRRMNERGGCNCIGRLRSTEHQRNDNVYLAKVSLNKNIKKNLRWQLFASMGHYDSTIIDISDSYYQVSSQLHWRF